MNSARNKRAEAGRVCEMSREDVTAAIEPSMLARIREQDPSPVYGAFVVGHEGTSCGEIVGRGGTAKRWSAAMVGEIARLLRERAEVDPVAVYDGHYRGRARRPLGRVSGAIERRIGERKAAVAVVYFPAGAGRDGFIGGQFDVGSIEADVLLSPVKSDGAIEVLGVERITGLALGSSATSTPGFAGAGLLRAVSEFADDSEEKVESLKREIERRGLSPSDVFEPAALAEDPKVQEIRVGNLQRAMGKISDLSEKVARLEDEAAQLRLKVQSKDAAHSSANESTGQRLVEDVAAEVTRDSRERKLLAELLDETAGSIAAEQGGSDGRARLRGEAERLHRRLRPFFGERGSETPLPPDRGKSFAAAYEDPANNELIP